MAKTSPTQRTLKALRKHYDVVWITEHWNHFARKRQDLFGIIDIVALGPGYTLGVQCTTFDNRLARVKKIKESGMLPRLSEANWRVQVWGWKKVKNRWECDIIGVEE